jgi:predicted membrane-bound mannosyltransferase
MQQIEPIAVVGSGYWPLPWYLKEFERVGYWPTVNDEMKTSPLVISMQSESEACTDVLKATHIPLPRGLRENVSIMLFLRYDLWQRWNEEAP